MWTECSLVPPEIQFHGYHSDVSACSRGKMQNSDGKWSHLFMHAKCPGAFFPKITNNQSSFGTRTSINIELVHLSVKVIWSRDDVFCVGLWSLVWGAEWTAGFNESHRSMNNNKKPRWLFLPFTDDFKQIWTQRGAAMVMISDHNPKAPTLKWG